MQRENESGILRRLTAAAVVAALVCVFASRAGAQDVKSYTVQTYIDWMQKYANAKPDFKAGDVLTSKDIERMRPFIMPGYLEQLNFPEFRAKIVPVLDHSPRRDYMDCTEKYGRQARIAPDNALENFVCGQPFPDSEISVNDPQAGIKEAWNYEWKWQNWGYCVMDHMWGWVRYGGNHDLTAPHDASAPPTDWTAGLTFKTAFPTGINTQWGGGGTFERTLQGFYQKTLMQHLPMTNGGPLPIPGAADFQHKEITVFFEPFDIRGTAFVIYRYIDPHRPDDGWAYIPTLRRVRRISAEVKSDSLLGTDLTIEDYYGWNGRELDWNWKFLGWKDVMGVYDPQDDYAHTYGPNGTIADDVWSVKRLAVVLRTPKWSRHPYSAAINFFEPQTWLGPFHATFDRKGKLWKVVQWSWKYSETYKDWAEWQHGVQAYSWIHLAAIDLQNDRATIIRGYGGGFPNYPMTEIQSTYDINRLEQVHR